MTNNNQDDTKMSILLVNDTFYPKFDGPVLVTCSYAKNFMQLPGVQVNVAAPASPGYTDDQPFNVIRVVSGKPIREGYRLGKPKKDKALKEFLKNNKIDIIHCHSPFSMCRFFAKYGKKHGIPTVFTFHTKFKEDFQRHVKSRLILKILMSYIRGNINRCDHVLTVSNGAGEVLRDYGYKKPYHVIRNGTDLTYPSGGKAVIDKLIASVNEKYGLRPDEKVFLSVGRIVANKKLDLALRAAKIASDKGHKFKMLVVGAGPGEDDVKALTTELGLDDKVIFTGKVMDREFLAAHYLRGDLFLLPSTFDTASLAPIEAAAMKLPTLMTEGCSTAEIVTADVNGLLAKETAEDWAEKMIFAITNSAKMKTISDNCHTQVFRTWKSVADEVFEYYKKILKERADEKKV